MGSNNSNRNENKHEEIDNFEIIEKYKSRTDYKTYLFDIYIGRFGINKDEV